ncbi:MAG: aspartate--tRNA(Asn) ligase [Nitrososphaerota archaeon]|jgi:asparaginyl-tRNA synthetase|nr:aspartate--tRNA(Asn) ligase [Nitrososphaerota archaeon]
MESPARRLRARQVFSAESGQNVELKGWVATKSSMGGLIFAVIRDGTGYVQVSAKKGVTPPDSMLAIQTATKESAVVVRGVVREDARAPGGREVSVRDFRIVSLAEPWPITKTAAASPSYLYDVRHLSIRSRKVGAAMKVRSEVVAACFDYFRERGFTLISAPTFVQAAVEGGSTLFGVDYFGKKVNLSQSAQFYEEAALASLEKVWVYQPAFRAEKSRTPKHLTEFWMVEAEQAFAGQPDNMKLQEELLAFIVKRVVENRGEELKILDRAIAVPSVPFDRVSYDEVRDIAAKEGMAFEWGEDVTTEAERLVSLAHQGPFFITDYPLSARSFYHMTYPDRPKVTMSADLIAPGGFGELATGGQRIADLALLIERIKSQDLPAEAFGWYLDLRKYGMPEHSGFGMGVERVTRWLAGLKHIRGASLFPRTMTRVSP